MNQTNIRKYPFKQVFVGFFILSFVLINLLTLLRRAAEEI